jgi:hypothetical protein
MLSLTVFLQQIYHWFFNTVRGNNRLRKILQLTSKQKVRLHLAQVYSVLFYKGDHKAEIDTVYKVYKQQCTADNIKPRDGQSWRLTRFNKILADPSNAAKAQVVDKYQTEKEQANQSNVLRDIGEKAFEHQEYVQ